MFERKMHHTEDAKCVDCGESIFQRSTAKAKYCNECKVARWNKYQALRQREKYQKRKKMQIGVDK